MTVNDLIDVLKKIGDEKFRKTAKIRIVVDEALDWPDGSYAYPSQFEVKTGINTVDIHI